MRVKFTYEQIKRFLNIALIYKAILFLNYESFAKINISLIKKEKRVYFEYKFFGFLPYRIYPKYDIMVEKDMVREIPFAMLLLFDVEKEEDIEEGKEGKHEFMINILLNTISVEFGRLPKDVLKYKWKTQERKGI